VRMHNGTLGLRMRSARLRAGLSMREVGVRVAQAIGRRTPFSAQNVQQWEVGKKTKGALPIAVTPTPEALLAFARLVGLPDTTWLVSGVELAGEGTAETAPTKGRVVAILEATAAAKRLLNYQSNQHVHTTVDCSEKSFGFVVFDLRNAPEFQVGDRVIIDPVVPAEPGMMVFAVVDGAPIFARYTAPKKVNKGHAEFVLEPLDQAWGPLPAATRSGDRIVGVMIEHTKVGPRPRYR
jgi:transcriptional regulator with XRE-family HTH domain